MRHQRIALANYDTNTGAGSSWEPRIADPRGRAFTLSVEYKFNKFM